MRSRNIFFGLNIAFINHLKGTNREKKKKIWIVIILNEHLYVCPYVHRLTNYIDMTHLFILFRFKVF